MRNKKIFFAILIFFVLIFGFCINCFGYTPKEAGTADEQITGMATDTDTSTVSGLGSLYQYKEYGDYGNGTFSSIVETILGVISTVGTILSVVVLAVMGIKYMMSSVEGKAEYKNNMTLYLVGAALVFMGSKIPQFIYEIMKNFNI